MARHQKLGSILRKGREANGMTLDSLAKRTRTSTTTLSRLENGDETRRPGEELLRRLARELKIDRDELFVAAGRLPADVAKWIFRPGALRRVREIMAA
jgi:transcriptional regulator with XRE-family HTH domain